MAYGFHAGRPWFVRLAMGAQATCVLAGFVFAQFPVLLRTQAGDMSYRELAAPPSVLRGLLWAVGIGLVIIAPALAYLILVKLYHSEGVSRLKHGAAGEIRGGLGAALLPQPSFTRPRHCNRAGGAGTCRARHPCAPW